MLLPSVIQEQFLSSDEVDFIVEFVQTTVKVWEDQTDDNRIQSYYYPWSYYSKDFSKIREIFDAKFKKLTDINLVIDHSHIFQSRLPYDVHSDFYQVKLLPKNLYPAYTIIIPIEDYDSHTIAFNQYSEIKKFDPSQYPKLNLIDDHTYKKYLSHVNQNIIDRLSIKEIFSWKKGSIHMCDRKYYHCSDNYFKNNIFGKKAIIMWTSIIKSDQP